MAPTSNVTSNKNASLRNGNLTLLRYNIEKRFFFACNLSILKLSLMTRNKRSLDYEQSLSGAIQTCHAVLPQTYHAALPKTCHAALPQTYHASLPWLVNHVTEDVLVQVVVPRRSRVPPHCRTGRPLQGSDRDIRPWGAHGLFTSGGQCATPLNNEIKVLKYT